MLICREIKAGWFYVHLCNYCPLRFQQKSIILMILEVHLTRFEIIGIVWRHSHLLESNLNLNESKKPEPCNYPAWIRKPVYGTQCENAGLTAEVMVLAVWESLCVWQCVWVVVGSVKLNPRLMTRRQGLTRLMMTDGVISEAWPGGSEMTARGRALWWLFTVHQALIFSRTKIFHT